MVCSPAQLASNRRNAAKSTGPKTAEGKARSRANSLKHGLTGEGIVLTNEDTIAVGILYDELHEEMRPQTRMGCILIRRAAMMAHRLDRSYEQESASVGEKKRNAAFNFDDKRHFEVTHTWDWISVDPEANLRKLKQTPEGCDRLLKGWLDVEEDLLHPSVNMWTYLHLDKVENMMGRRAGEYPTSRAKAFTYAIFGEFRFLTPDDGADLGDDARRKWAQGQMALVIKEEIAKVEAHRSTLKFDDHAQDRLEAAARAQFDASKEAILARKYEAACERSLLRSLKEFRQVEKEFAELPEDDATLYEEEDKEQLASSLKAQAGAESEEVEEAPEGEETEGSPPETDFERPSSDEMTPEIAPGEAEIDDR